MVRPTQPRHWIYVLNPLNPSSICVFPFLLFCPRATDNSIRCVTVRESFVDRLPCAGALYGQVGKWIHSVIIRYSGTRFPAVYFRGALCYLAALSFRPGMARYLCGLPGIISHGYGIERLSVIVAITETLRFVSWSKQKWSPVVKSILNTFSFKSRDFFHHHKASFKRTQK